MGIIVEYIEQGKFICALVLSADDKRVRVINQNGREVNLPKIRILHSSNRATNGGESREDLQRLLLEVNERRKSLAGSVNLAEIWELASAEAQERFSTEFLAALCYGEEPADDQIAAFLRAVFEDRLYFKYREGAIVVHTPEVVEQLREREERELSRVALLSRGAENLARLAKGEDPGDWPEQGRCLDLVRNYYLFGNDFEESELARDLLKEARLTRDHDVYHLLISAGIWKSNENVPFLRQQLPKGFSDEALHEAAGFGEPDPESLLAEKYRDYTHLPLLTIDGGATRDFDDALHVEKIGDNFRVGIHISDVARYIRPGMALFEEARRRCSSLYFPDERIPMLPESLSEGVCSLIKGRLRAVISFIVDLSRDGEILDTNVVPAMVRVQRQLSYPEADRLLDGDEELGILNDLAGRLRERRIAAGAIIMPFPDVVIKIGSDDEIEVRLEDADSGSRVLVAELMVLANTLGASFVADRQVPGLFRGQDQPHKRLYQGFQRELFVNFRQRRFLKPARITTGPHPHSCVGVMQYTTMTSPIRRFFDLIMQHQVLSLCQGKGARFPEYELAGFVAEITKAQSRMNLVRRLRHRYWLLKHLEKRVGERVNGLVIEKGPHRVNIVLTDYLMESDLPRNQAVKAEPGDVIQVRIAKVSVLDDLLRIEW